MDNLSLFANEKAETTCCFTGYRPSKFPFSLETCNNELVKLENDLISSISSLIEEEHCYTYYSGMAMGFDIIASETVLLLKNAYKDKEINLYCAVPFQQQSITYSEPWQKRYNEVLNKCKKRIILSENYSLGCYQKRNKYMVDKSDFIVTWYDGQTGGTRNTLKYAEKKGRGIINLF